MVNLVEVVKGELMASSDLIAKEFGIAHNEILKKLINSKQRIMAKKIESWLVNNGM